MTYKIVFGIFCLFFISRYVFGSTPPSISEADEILGFADFLRESEDYYRAIGEYKRFVFLLPNDERIPNVLYKIALCEQARGKYDRAIQAYNSFLENNPQGNSLATLARFQIAECYRLLSDYEKVRQTLQPMIKDHNIPSPLRFKIWHRLGWCELQERKFDNANEIFRKMEAEFVAQGSEEETHLANLMRNRVQKAKHVPRKSPWLAGGLSTITPGSGQIYLGRHGDGVFSFLTIAILSTLSHYNFRKSNQMSGWILGGLTAGFYLGNIYGAIATSFLINQQRESAYLREIDQIYRSGEFGVGDDF